MRWRGRVRWMVLPLALLLLVMGARPAAAASTHVVAPGETLTGIAQRYGVSVSALAAANQMTVVSWVYTGQRLTVPDGTGAAAAAPAAGTGSYTVLPGDTLYGIAGRHGTTVTALMGANGLTSSHIFVGQRLRLPGAGGGGPVASNPVLHGPKWIDVNVSTQTITAFEGNTPLYTAVVSTGLPRTPTVIGTFPIYVKYEKTDMRGGSVAYGDYYYLEDVPYTMYFYRGYGIHGTYWHNNFGRPMSHGCVNLTIADARWFFNWAEIGTQVVTHY